MFTGLIEDVGELRQRRVLGEAGKLVVATKLPLAEIAVGDSVAVNGACLTVEECAPEAGQITFHTLRETLQRTNLGLVPVGGRLNLERALRLDARLGGHFVLGHVDATAAVQEVRRLRDDIVVRIELSRDLAPLLIAKGSIAVDGISLTVGELGEDSFTVNVIPHTWRHTTLRSAEPGKKVNLEGDLLGKYVVRAVRNLKLAGEKSTIDMNDLFDSGFLP